MLSDEQIERYSRQIILPQVGGKGQEKLLHARILVSAAGSLQTAVLHYLAASGVGTLGVVARGESSLLNALASPQESSPFSILTRLNPDCSLVFHSGEQAPLGRLVQDYDLILSDTAALHDACYTARRPFFYVSLTEEEARLVECRGYEPNAPCLRCLSLPPPQLSSSPLFDIAALFMGAQLATEAIKQIVRLPSSLKTKVLHFHWMTCSFTEDFVTKSPTCSLCRSLPLENF